MPIYVKVIDNQGGFVGGFAQGYCEYYDTTKDIVMKGHFSYSKLTGTNNTLIHYTDTTFTYYYGQFVNNQPDGNIMMYEFKGNGDLLRNIVAAIPITKSNCIFSAGKLVSTISTQQVQATISVQYKQSVGYEYMVAFNVHEL